MIQQEKNWRSMKQNRQKYCNKEKIDMILFNVAKSVMEVFEMTGFADILTIE